ncbi:hypothetical protein [Streptomyces dubilierae]|uniref:Uncharacterized protein n=1 Tax=Streptomyces dubilierae TaxID=3075533 RepID=A0ABU2P6M8_9ACTN|nr:hypothetical protein [Streptomyces sp. DSM 41921]MDT0387803.1 hypothetical protein [Streptomyces sp. DSM 41921]
MAWSAPMTAVANSTFTAAQFNTYVRDNLNETAPAKATAASQIPVSTGPNAITMRSPSTARVDTAQTTTSTTYADLATIGPRITVETGPIAVIAFAADMTNTAETSLTKVSVAVSGASSLAASDQWMLSTDGHAANNFNRHAMVHTFVGLTPGSNTFTMKYAVGSNSGTFRNREINIIPL